MSSELCGYYTPSSVYRDLITNLQHSQMQFSDYSFHDALADLNHTSESTLCTADSSNQNTIATAPAPAPATATASADAIVDVSASAASVSAGVTTNANGSASGGNVEEESSLALPNYPHRVVVQRYLQQFANRFALMKHILLETYVVHVC
jgi:hypothetical protein